jgi:hypothetical protein
MYIGDYISRGTAAAITWASRASGLRMQEAGIVRHLIAEGRVAELAEVSAQVE